MGLVSQLGHWATVRLWDSQRAPNPLGAYGSQRTTPRTNNSAGSCICFPWGLHSSVISASVACSVEDTAFHFCAFKCLFSYRLTVQIWNQNGLNQSSPLTPPPPSSPGAETPVSFSLQPHCLCLCRCIVAPLSGVSRPG